MLEKTLSIIKPDGTKRNLIGKIMAMFEAENIQISASSGKIIFIRGSYTNVNNYTS